MIIIKILVISEKFANGGLETHIKTLYKEFEKTNEIVYCLNKNSKIDSFTDKKIYNDFIFSSNSTISDFVSDVEKLVSIINQEKIDVIHVHPFFSIYSAAIAANITNIPIFYTCHGKTSINFCCTFVEQILYFYIIEQIFSKVFCVNKFHVDYFNRIKKNIAVYIPNMIDINKYKKSEIIFNKKWALISRIDEDKISEIELLLDYLPILDIDVLDIYGNGNQLKFLQNLIEQKKLDNKVFLKNYIDDVYNTLNGNYCGIIGIGRVTLESLSMGYPTMLIGYGKIGGIIDNNLFLKVSKINFVPETIKNINCEELNNQIIKVNNGKIRNLDFRKKIIKNYSVKRISKKYYNYFLFSNFFGLNNVNKLFNKIKQLNNNEFGKELFFESKNIYYLLKEYIDPYSINSDIKNIFIVADDIYRVENNIIRRNNDD